MDEKEDAGVALPCVGSYNGYNLYKAELEKDVEIFNIVPKGHPAPTGGYLNKAYICLLKQVPLFVFDVKEDSSTICCQACGEEYDRRVGDYCPRCNNNTQERDEE